MSCRSANPLAQQNLEDRSIVELHSPAFDHVDATRKAAEGKGLNGGPRNHHIIAVAA